MPWVVVDVVLPATAVAVLGVLLLRLWRQVKALSGAVKVSSERVANATADLDRLHAQFASRTAERDRLP